MTRGVLGERTVTLVLTAEPGGLFPAYPGTISPDVCLCCLSRESAPSRPVTIGGADRFLAPDGGALARYRACGCRVSRDSRQFLIRDFR